MIRIEYVVFFIGLALIYFLGEVKLGNVYAINDDWGLYDVLNGSFLGYPGAHVSFMEYPVSWFISIFYRINPAVPWYGIFLEGCLALCGIIMFARTHDILKNNDIWLRLIAETILYLFWSVMTLGITCRIQYTTVSGVCAATALFWFMSEGDEEKGSLIQSNIPAVLLAVLAEGIRPEMIYMCLLVMFPMWLIRWLRCRDRFSRQKIKNYLGLVVLFGIVLGMQLLCSRIAYSSKEWQDFRTVDRCRVKLADYYGYPDYESHEDEFRKAGIDRDSYELVKGSVMYAGRNITVQQWELLVKTARTEYNNAHPLGERLTGFIQQSKVLIGSGDLRPWNRIVIYLIAVAIVLVLAMRDRGSAADLASVLAGTILCYMVMVLRGRVLDRVQISLLWMTGSVLVAVMIRILSSVSLNGISKAMTRLLVVIVLVFVCFTGVEMRHQYNNLRQMTDSDRQNAEVWNGIKRYCNEHSDNLYVFMPGSKTLYYYCEDPLRSGKAAYENYLYIGSGHMMNPNTVFKLKRYGITDLLKQCTESNKNIYFISSEDAFLETDVMTEHLSKANECSMTISAEKKDKFRSGNVTYLVYQYIIQ